MKYTHEFYNVVNGKLPTEIVEVMAKHGWNAVGVYEMVAEQRREHRKWKLPVFVKELESKRQDRCICFGVPQNTNGACPIHGDS